MKITFEITTSRLVISSGSASEISQLVAQRGSGEYIALELLENGQPWAAPGGTEFVFCVKHQGDFAGEALAAADTWVYDATSGLWEAAINYEVEALDEMLLVSSERESAYVNLAAQFALQRSTLGEWRRSQVVAFKLQNNLWRGSEDGPALPSASLLRPSIVAIAADVINNNAVANTIANVTGLKFPVKAGKTYGFEFLIPYTAAAITTGSRWSVNGPAQTLLAFRTTSTLTATTDTTTYGNAYDTPSAAGASSLTAGNIATIQGVVKPSADGDLIARFASEVAGSAITVKAGASVKYWEMP